MKMKQHFSRRAGCILGLALATAGLSAQAEIVFHYVQPALNGVNGNVVVSSIPDGGTPVSGKTVCFSYGLGSTAMSQKITWPVYGFTGMSVPSLSGDFQAGINNNAFGSSACQINGTQMGFQVHKPSAPAEVTFYGMILQYTWPNLSQMPFPWASTYPANAALRIQGNYKVGQRDSQGAIQYGHLTVGLRDRISGRGIWYVLSPWDSRGVPAESVHADSGGTNNVNIDTHFGRNTRFATIHPHSQTTAGDSACQCQWYAAWIAKANLQSAIATANGQLNANLFSTDPANYQITSLGAGTEMYSPPGTTGWIGSNVSDVMVLTEY